MLTQSHNTASVSESGPQMEVSSTNPMALSKSALILKFPLAPTCFGKIHVNKFHLGFALPRPKSLPGMPEESVIGFVAKRVIEELMTF